MTHDSHSEMYINLFRLIIRIKTIAYNCTKKLLFQLTCFLSFYMLHQINPAYWLFRSTAYNFAPSPYTNFTPSISLSVFRKRAFNAGLPYLAMVRAYARPRACHRGQSTPIWQISSAECLGEGNERTSGRHCNKSWRRRPSTVLAALPQRRHCRLRYRPSGLISSPPRLRFPWTERQKSCLFFSYMLFCFPNQCEISSNYWADNTTQLFHVSRWAYKNNTNEIYITKNTSNIIYKKKSRIDFIVTFHVNHYLI